MPSWMGGGFGWGVYVADSAFEMDGRMRGADLGNTYGAFLTYQYEDDTKRLSTINLTRQGYPESDLDLHYRYDAAGNITSIADQKGSVATGYDNQCFGYDGLQRLELAWTAVSGDCNRPAAQITASDVGGASPYWH